MIDIKNQECYHLHTSDENSVKNTRIKDNLYLE